MPGGDCIILKLIFTSRLASHFFLCGQLLSFLAVLKTFFVNAEACPLTLFARIEVLSISASTVDTLPYRQFRCCICTNYFSSRAISDASSASSRPRHAVALGSSLVAAGYCVRIHLEMGIILLAYRFSLLLSFSLHATREERDGREVRCTI